MKKQTQRNNTYEGYGSTYDVEILNSFKCEI